MVLYAELDRLLGLSAIVAMLSEGLRFRMEVGVWPRECTVVVPWASARDAAQRDLEPGMG